MKLIDEIEQLDQSVRKLKAGYEKYFAGLDRLQPIREHDKVKATLRRLRSHQGINTAMRFKLQAVQASLITHETYWNRICNQIERGTYKRDRMRAQKRLTNMDQSPTDVTTTQAAPKPKPAPDNKHPETIKTLHAVYAKAQQDAGAKTMVDINSLAKTIAAQTEVIKKKYRCNSVEFKVALKNGKPILKAIPR